MKKFFSVLLCLITVVSIIPYSTSAADDAPDDVPKIYINTSSSITNAYSACEITVVDESGGKYGTVTDTAASVKVRGNSTSSGAKKPFNIKFSSKTDLLGMGKNKKWCLLANCYEKTLIRNQTVLDFAESTSLKYTPSYRVVDVYLNGKYNGCYLLTDAVAVSPSRVDIDIDSFDFLLERDVRTDEGTLYFESPYYGIRFGINEPEAPTNEQYDWLLSFLLKAEKALASGNYSEVEKFFDIDTMADFYIVLEYFKNVDINVGSTRFYIEDGVIYGGPCWDFDLSSGNCSYDYYKEYNNYYGSGKSYEGFWAQTLWFKYLWNYSEFRKTVKYHYLALQDTIINLYEDDILGENYIDSCVSRYGKAIERNYNLWSIKRQYSDVCGTLERYPESTYSGNLEYYRQWLKKRNEWLLSEWELSPFITVKTNSSYTIENYTVKNVMPETAALSFLLNFDNSPAVYNQGALLSSTDVVSNGCTVSVGGLNYLIIVRGDIASDGHISALDYALLKRIVLGTYNHQTVGISAGDINSDGKINAIDYAMLKRHVLGTYNIYK